MNRDEGAEMQGQAEYWFLRLQDPDITRAERTACEQWRLASPAHEAAWREVEIIWRDTEALAQDAAILQALRFAERPSATVRIESRWRGWLPLGGLAAAALVVLAVLVPRQFGNQAPPPGTRYATALGEQRTITLSDGSVVVLDTSTSIVERFTDDQRRIDLQQGQADFQVKSDKLRPFVVHAAGGEVTAVGTRFQVRAEGSAASVTLLEGVVKVDSPESERGSRTTATLSPGQRLQFDQADNRWNTETIDLEASRGWADGNLFVRNWRLGDLLAEMNRYSTTQLRLADPSLADLPISGTFRVGDHASLVLALEHGWSLHAEQSARDEIVLRK